MAPLAVMLPYLSAAATALTAVGAAKSIFGGKGGAPQVQKPAVMPTADDTAVREAQRKRMAQIAAQSGRASTVLSQDESLGG